MELVSLCFSLRVFISIFNVVDPLSRFHIRLPGAATFAVVADDYSWSLLRIPGPSGWLVLIRTRLGLVILLPAPLSVELIKNSCTVMLLGLGK